MRQESFSNPRIKPETFSLPFEPILSQKQLDEQMALAWKDLQELWDEVNPNKMDITEARKKWILPFFRALGFKPVYQPQDIITSGDERLKFHISHRGFPEERDPMIHTVSPSEDLDVRNANDRNKKSPHDTIQIYLNIEKKAQWALLTNGIILRILRDFYHTSTNGYVEFDLQNIFTDRNYSDFRALYRMVHASRFSKDKDGITSLEHFYKESLAAGVKVGEDLRGNVKKAIETLGNGFLTGELAQRMISGEKFCKEYYEELLHVIYRILFLLFAEQRGMLPSRDSLYAEEYSITKLRERAENYTGKDKHTDMWHGLKVTFRLLKQGNQKLKVFPYNGSLFDDERLKIISALSCRNEELLTAIRYLTLIEKDKVLQRISYLDLGVEEIGSIYESLLEFTPRVLVQNETVEGELINDRTFFLDPRGTARKTTGSYYTNPLLVDELIKSALIPVVKKKIAPGKTPLEMGELLLSLKVCDLSCGSAAFLIAAVNYMGRELAKLRTGTEYPSDKEERRAKRDVLQHCIYGVDLNPMAVELAKVSLWINCVVEDMPLNFLDHHIKCGNSLIGTTPDLLLKGIPDEAFTPLEGDDKKVAKEFMSINKVQKKSQSLVGWGIREDEKIDTDKFIKLSDLPEDKPEGVAKKEDCYNQLTKSYTYSHQKLLADIWTSAFFWPLTKERDAPTQGVLRMLHEGDSEAMDKKIVDKVKALAEEYRFFHWYLEFPEVFQREEAGFDCVIGNPPFLGGWKIRGNYGDKFNHYLTILFAPAKGRADFCAYFYRRVFDLMRRGGILGMVATNTIGQGDTRETGLAFIIKIGGTITFAHRFIKWLGSANVEVNLVAIHKGIWGSSRLLDNSVVSFISSRLDDDIEQEPKNLQENIGKAFVGDAVRGIGFALEPQETENLILRDSRNSDCLYPFLNGEDLNQDLNQKPSRYVICFHDWPLVKAREYPDLLRIVEERVKPERDIVREKHERENWWLFARYRGELRRAISSLKRVLVRASTSEMHMIAFVPKDWICSHAINVFAFDDCYHFSLLQSNIHEVWLRLRASTMRTDIRYTPSTCFDTFPFPQSPSEQSRKLADKIGEEYNEFRQKVMIELNIGLTKIYNLINNPDIKDENIKKLRELHTEMDKKILVCYGWNDINLKHDFYRNDRSQIRYTISELANRELLIRLLDLNLEIFAKEHDKEEFDKIVGSE